MLKFSCEKALLQLAVNTASRTVATKSSIPALEGLLLEEVREFPVDGASHAVIVLRKIAPTPKQYPRRYAKIKQSPL